MLDRRWFCNDGPFVKELEPRLAELIGVKHCVSMCNATIALEIVIRALELKGEVIVPSFTFIATAHALQWQEITPVFVDIDPQTHNIDPAAVRTPHHPAHNRHHRRSSLGAALRPQPLEVVAARQNLNLFFRCRPRLRLLARGTG